MKIRIKIIPRLSMRNANSVILKVLFLLSFSGSELLAEAIEEPQAAPRIAQWEQTIKNFEALDAKNPPPKGAVLLVGGSNARRWSNVVDYFPKHQVINRGFGGARLTEILHFADRIILPYEPQLLLVNAGGNDMAAGTSLDQVLETAEALIATVRANLPNARICFIGLPHIRRAIRNPEIKILIDDFNKQLSGLADREAKVVFIDLVPAFLDDKGEFQPSLFVEDGTHFSAEGYEVVAGLIKEVF